jgi:hypothetical protein
VWILDALQRKCECQLTRCAVCRIHACLRHGPFAERKGRALHSKLHGTKTRSRRDREINAVRRIEWLAVRVLECMPALIC